MDVFAWIMSLAKRTYRVTQLCMCDSGWVFEIKCCVLRAYVLPTLVNLASKNSMSILLVIDIVPYYSRFESQRRCIILKTVNSLLRFLHY